MKYKDEHKDAQQNTAMRWRDQLNRPNTLGRIKRCVWKISTKPFSGAHFAVFPPDLVETMIKAGCPEFICNKCQTPRKLEYEETRVNTRPGLDVLNAKSGTDLDPNHELHKSDLSKYRQQIIRRFKSMGGDSEGNYDGQSIKDYTNHNAQDASETKRRILESYKKRANSELVMTDCGCNADWNPGIILDPFAGAGTTGLVALRLGRKFVGIELNPEYIQIINTRLDPLLKQTKL